MIDGVTPAERTTILGHIRAGAFPDVACGLAGVNGDPQDDLLREPTFRRQVARAESEYVEELRSRLFAGDETAQPLLEARFPKMFKGEPAR